MENQTFENGISIRTSRLFNEKTGRCVAIAMDHGATLGAVAGLERIGERFAQVVAGKPDAVLVAHGTMRKYGCLLMGKSAPAAILALDFPLFNSYPGGERIDGQAPALSAEEAVRLGADMAKICMIFGREEASHQIENFSYVARTIEQCHKVGLPVMVEPTTWGLRFEGTDTKNTKLLADMARIAYEVGADVVKSDFPIDGREMGKIVESCPVPILLLGGGKSASLEDMLANVLLCVQNGARGVTFGRNVWQHPNPSRVIKAYQKVVHEEDLKGALEEMA